MDKNILYSLIRPIITFITRVFIRPDIINANLIPKRGRIILAGTHTNNLDCFLLVSATKRKVHFLAKEELWHGPKKIIFSNLGLIPVKRNGHDHEALLLAYKYLENDSLIGIFPEGTTEKGRGLLPFKLGTVKMASVTNSNIIPFVIKGHYHLFSKDLSIVFGNPIHVNSEDLIKENERLRNIIKEMRD